MRGIRMGQLLDAYITIHYYLSIKASFRLNVKNRNEAAGLWSYFSFSRMSEM